jgi:predicted AlkP superfamily phosphohydrolase/phosphomutase
MGKRRLVVLGLDGADWKILDPLIREGSLPNFKHVAENGSRARLKSTVPPLTAPAWQSIFTGVNPGKHGVFDFAKVEGGQIKFTSSRDSLVPYVWELVNEQTLAFNIPCAYPVRRHTNKILVSGFCTPSAESGFAYPEEIKDEILRIVPDYTPHFRLKEKLVHMGMAKNKNGLEQSILSNLQDKLKVARHLLEHKEWQAAFIVFSATDWIQHSFMHEFVDAPEKSKTRIAKAYTAIDTLIGYLIEKDYDLIIISDHGFKDIRQVCFLNTYLHRKGLIKLRVDSFRRLMKFLGITQENLLPALSLVGSWGISKYLHGILRRLPRKYPAPEDFDIPNSSAFLLSGSGNGVFLRTPADTDSIADTIVNCTDEEGKRMIKAVLRREDLYHGAAVTRSPHLILVPEDDVLLKGTICPRISKDVDTESEMDGYHDQYGIFVAYGEGFIKTTLSEDVMTSDIAPTILAHLGYGIPKLMDGKPLPLLANSAISRSAFAFETRARLKSLIRKRALSPSFGMRGNK